MNSDSKVSRRQERLQSMPEATLPERVEESVRAAGGGLMGAMVPGIGDAVATFLGGFFPSIRKRREDAWFNDLRGALNELARHAVRVEDLKDNEAFHDIVCAASQAAMRTHLEEKRRALRNAIVNAALPDAPMESKQHMFVRLIEDLQDIHLHLLDLLANPQAYFASRNMQLPVHNGPVGMFYDAESSNASLRAVTLLAFDTYRGQSELLDLVLAELNRRGLVTSTNLIVPCRRDEGIASQLGLEFLRFIRDPAPPGEYSP